jgi:hypothetical protein
MPIAIVYSMDTAGASKESHEIEELPNSTRGHASARLPVFNLVLVVRSRVALDSFVLGIAGEGGPWKVALRRT